MGLTENGNCQKKENFPHSRSYRSRRENEESTEGLIQIATNNEIKILSFNKIGMEFEINNYSVIRVDLDVYLSVWLCVCV